MCNSLVQVWAGGRLLCRCKVHCVGRDVGIACAGEGTRVPDALLSGVCAWPKARWGPRALNYLLCFPDPAVSGGAFWLLQEATMSSSSSQITALEVPEHTEGNSRENKIAEPLTMWGH